MIISYDVSTFGFVDSPLPLIIFDQQEGSAGAITSANVSLKLAIAAQSVLNTTGPIHEPLASPSQTERTHAL